MFHAVCLLSLLVSSYCDVVHLEEQSTPQPPHRAYAFAYTAGRYPGHTDRHHAEVSDGSGAVRGTFSYVDPSKKVRRVDYVADKDGFHPILSEDPPEHPKDSHAVALAKERHHQLYERIAADHASNHHPQVRGSSSPRQSAAVVAETEKHATLFKVIAEQHARIAAEREALQHEEEGKQLQELWESPHEYTDGLQYQKEYDGSQ